MRALCEEHAGALLGYTTGLVGDRGRAEDIVQEVLLRAWQHADRLDARTRSLRPWLFTVAANLAVDHHRSRKARPVEDGDEGLDRQSAGDGVERAVEAWDMTDALGWLGPQHRAVLVETYYRGRSVAEAAMVLGIPAGTVKSRTYYALHALRRILEEHS